MPCGEAPLTVSLASSGRCDLHVFEARPDRWCNSTGARHGSEDTDRDRQTDEQRLDAAKYTIHGWLQVLTKGLSFLFTCTRTYTDGAGKFASTKITPLFFISPY